MSFVLHAAAFAAIAAISTGNVPRPIAVMIAEVAPPEAPAPAPPPPAEAPREVAPARARAAPRSIPPATAAATDVNAAPDFGVALEGVSAGTGGVAVAVGETTGAQREATTRLAARTLAPTPVRHEARGCREDEVPPRPLQMPRVVYTQEALELHVEGRVRLSVTLDDAGHVTGATVLSPLGHGLDEAALDAVRAAHFEPATRCGHAVATTFVLGVRFRI